MKRWWTGLAVLLALAAPARSAPDVALAPPAVEHARLELPQEASASLALPTGFRDDGDKDSLLLAIDRQREWLDKSHSEAIHLGDRAVSVERLRMTCEAFGRLVEEDFGTPAFERKLKERFEVVNLAPPGEVQVTGYYLPILEARRRKEGAFRFPLYRRPADLVTLDLSEFNPRLNGEKIMGRYHRGELVPYPTRAEIEDGNALAGRGLEVAWLNSELDRFLLMIQGSGILRFPDSTARLVNFAGSNGRPYVSLGKLLVAAGKIPAARISIPAIRQYFDQHPSELHGYLVQNPTVVFFRMAESGPYGVDGIQLTPGRSIATDKRLAPSGAIAYLRFPRPKLGFDGEPLGYETVGRFVCDQDAGAAIKGPGRADVYWGSGEEAGVIAGTLNASGSLSYLLLKPEAEGSL